MTSEATLPAWRRETQGEHRWPAVLAVVVAIVLQVVLPDKLSFKPRWLLPALEAALLLGIVAIEPGRLQRESKHLRRAGITVCVLVGLANAWSGGLLVRGLLSGRLASEAGVLMRDGSLIWLTNVIVFGLLYWEFDRGGPLARAKAIKPDPDFLFPQMNLAQDGAARDWEPLFFDYFYVSFTNATAFSPTDALPLSRWAKALMLVQSAIALVTVILVIARAINALA